MQCDHSGWQGVDGMSFLKVSRVQGCLADGDLSVGCKWEQGQDVVPRVSMATSIEDWDPNSVPQEPLLVSQPPHVLKENDCQKNDLINLFVFL